MQCNIAVLDASLYAQSIIVRSHQSSGLIVAALFSPRRRAFFASGQVVKKEEEDEKERRLSLVELSGRLFSSAARKERRFAVVMDGASG